jgi:hypothetical protein
MKLLFFKLGIRLFASILGLVLYIGFFTNHFKNKYDPYYVKLLNKTNRGLILGDSRALQGINPKYLKFPTFNFAFTIGHSPFDDSYLKIIQKKIDTISKVKRHHIISVTPWSLLSPELVKDDINPYFSENLYFHFSNPNWEYILKYWDLSFVNSLKLMRNKSYTTDYGWNNQNIERDELYREYPRRVREKVQNYKLKYKRQILTLESHRVQNLINIIRFLRKTGRVTIIRLPISKEMLELENQVFPSINNLINKIAKDNSLYFIDLTDLNIQTTDGNHIWGGEVPRVMQELNRRIL